MRNGQFFRPFTLTAFFTQSFLVLDIEMFFPKALCAVAGLTAAIAGSASAQTATTPIRAIPNADHIMVYEITDTSSNPPSLASNPPTAFPLSPTGGAIDIVLNPLNANTADFIGINNPTNGSEFYDAFLSDSDATPNPNGACVTIRANSTASDGVNIARVDLNDAASSIMRSFDVATMPIRANTSFVDHGNMVDVDDFTSTTWSHMGNGQGLGATLCFAAPQITWQKTVAPTQFPVLAGDPVQFGINATLQAADLWPGDTLTLTDTVPAGLSYNGFTGADWNCAFGAPTVTCIYTAPASGMAQGNLPALTLDFSVAADATAGTVTNCATMTSPPNGTTLSVTQSCVDVTLNEILELHHYPVKYVCGFSLGHDPNPVGPVTSTGAFYTEINILNPDWREVDVFKTITPLVIEGGKAYREPDLSEVVGDEEFTMTGQTGTMDDCRKLGEMMGEDDLAMRPLDIGYLSIYSTRPLDVTAVYTAMGTFKDQHNTALDIEQIEGRLVEILR